MHIGIISHNYPSASGKKDAGILIWEIARSLKKSALVSVFRVGDNQTLGSWHVSDPRSIIKFMSLMRSGTAEARTWTLKNHIDVLLAMWAIPAGLIARNIHKELGIPYAVMALGSDIHIYSHIPILKKRITQSLQDANLRISNSHFLCREVTKLSGLPCQFIPTATTFPLDNMKHIALDKKRYQFLFVGRLEKIKGIDVLLEACVALQNQHLAFDLHIIGDGSMRASVQKRITTFRLPIYLHGALDQPKIAGYMYAADCIVIPSRHESLPLAFIEAAKVGLPVIASDVGDSGYVTHKYNTGLLFESENVTRLRQAMEKMIALGRRAKHIYTPGLQRLTRDYRPATAPKMLMAALRLLYRSQFPARDRR